MPGTYADKSRKQTGARVNRGKAGPSTPSKAVSGTYSQKTGGTAGARVARGK